MRLKQTRSLPAHVVTKLSRGQYGPIARRAGLAPQHVGRVLRGMKGASLHVAARIAHAADVTLDDMYRFILQQPELNIQGRKTRRELWNE